MPLALMLTLTYVSMVCDAMRTHDIVFDKLLSNSVELRKLSIEDAQRELVGFHRAETVPLFYTIIYLNPIPAHGAPEQKSYSMENSPRRLALRIVSNWSNTELTALYLDFLDYIRDDQWLTFSDQPLYESYLAVKGLINIGQPCLKACINEITKNRFEGIQLPPGHDRGLRRMQLLAYTIWMISGPDQAKQLLRKEHERLVPINAAGAANIRQALEYLSTHPRFAKNH